MNLRGRKVAEEMEEKRRRGEKERTEGENEKKRSSLYLSGGRHGDERRFAE